VFYSRLKTGGCLFLLLFFSTIIPAQQRPNIILILIDDMGWQDCSVPFWSQITESNKRYHTPNMERMASQGLKFTNAYAAPVCSPTRVSLMSGMNAAHHKVTNWTLDKDQSVDYSDSLLQSPEWNINGLSTQAGIKQSVFVTPLPQIMQQAGYFTIHVGKAHFAASNTPAADPVNMGFDFSIAGHAAGAPGSYLGEKNFGNIKGQHSLPWGVPGLEKYHGTDIFLTEALTREAVSAMEIPLKKHQPFFLYLAHYAVHIPLEADKRFYQRYIEKGLDSSEAKYASLIEGMDKSLGDIMKYIEERGIEKNTVIIFMSDNGGLSLPPRKGMPYTHNLPLRSGKGSVYEGGIRVPMLLKWPAVVKPGTVSSQYLIAEDLFPTLLDMAGIKKYNTAQQVDGRSFLTALKNPDIINNKTVLVWHFPNKWIVKDGPGINFFSAIRKGRWKMVYNIKTGSRELYDLQTDIGEQLNLSSVHPQILKELSSLLGKRLRQWKGQMPVIKKTGLAAPMSDEVK
jgi:arylsulfatase A-like enzyme